MTAHWLIPVALAGAPSNRVQAFIEPPWFELLGCEAPPSDPAWVTAACALTAKDAKDSSPARAVSEEVVALLAPMRPSLEAATDHAALFLLEIDRREALLAFRDHVMPGERLLRDARSLVSRTTDPAVRERAQLYIVAFLGAGLPTDTYDIDGAYGGAVDLVGATPDPFIRRTAIDLLTSTPGRDLWEPPPGALAVLLDHCPSSRGPRLAHFGLEVSERRDPGALPEWIACCRAALARKCQPSDPICFWLRARLDEP